MKERSLSFPFIFFFKSGLFRGLRPIQIKNFSRSLDRLMGFFHTIFSGLIQ
jgi:hypothetical protein